MKREYIFPILLMLIDIGAAIMNGISRDWKKAIYWIAATILNITVTF